MSTNNYVDPENIYPWVHPDDTNLTFEVGSEKKWKIYTFDTLERIEKYISNDTPPFVTDTGTIVVFRINELYRGSKGKILMLVAYGTGVIGPDSGKEIINWVEVPLQNGDADDNGDGTPDSFLDGGLFQGVIEIGPKDVPAATLALDNTIRENTPPPTSEEPPSTADVSLEASVSTASAPATKATTETASDAEAALAPDQIYDTVTTNAALADPAIETSIRNATDAVGNAVPGAAALADEYVALQSELATGQSLPRTNEIMTRLNAIQTSLPPSAAAAASGISSAIAPALNPGNIPGLENIANSATSLATSFLPTAGASISDLTGDLNFANGLDLSSLSGLSQTISGGLQATTALLGSGNLLDNLPNINNLLKLDPTALINNIDLGAVANSISQIDVKTISQQLANGVMDVVDQAAATFGPIGRGFPENPALRDIATSTDAGFGYTGSRSTSSGAAIRQSSTITPEAEEGGPPPTATTPYKRLIEILERTLTQDWRARSGSSEGTVPSSQDPRGREQVPPAPPGSNPLIMEAYRISGQANFTRDGVSGEYSWHTAFVNWVLSKAGLDINASMSAQAYYTYGDRVNHTNLRNLAAKRGDLVIFNSRTGAKHIGFLWEFNDQTNKISILGGNQAGTVKISEFPFSLKDGDFYVTHIRRNWVVPPGTVTVYASGTATETAPSTESPIGPTTPVNSTATETVPSNARSGSSVSGPGLDRAEFSEDGKSAKLPVDATPQEKAAVSAKLEETRQSRDTFGQVNEIGYEEDLSDVELPKKPTPEERAARDAERKAKKKEAADKKKAKQAKDDAFYGGGAFSTAGGSTTSRVTTTGGGSTTTYAPERSEAAQTALEKQNKTDAYNRLLSTTYSSQKRATSSIRGYVRKYGGSFIPYQDGTRWRVR